LLRIIDRYLLRELSGPFGFGIILFAALMIGTILLSDVLRTLQKYDLSLLLILKYLALSAPQFLILCIPMGALLGTLIAVGRLNSDHEIVAIRAAGFDLYRVLLPFLIVGVFLAGMTMIGSEYLVPASRAALLQMKNDIRAGKFGGTQEKVTIPIMEGDEVRWALYAESMQGTELRNMVLIYFDPRSRRNDIIMTATRGEWSGGHWEFSDMRLSQIGSGGSTQLGRLESDEVAMPDFNVSPAQLEAKRMSPEDVSARQLRRYIDEQLAHQAEIKVDPNSVEALQDLHDQIAEEATPETEKTANNSINVPIFRNEELRWVIVAESAEGNELHDVRIIHLDKRSREQNYVVQAARAQWNGRDWKFYDMRKVRIDPEEQQQPLISMLREGPLPEFRLSPDDLALKNQALEDMNAEQLRLAIAALRISGGELNARDLRAMLTELYFKYTIPLTPVFFIWIAFPLAIMPQRASYTRGMGIALMIILAYMASVALFRSLGTAGVMPPLAAAWIPNLALAAVGWRLLERRQRS
jgi:lipopolysaccharide export system permease protein